MTIPNYQMIMLPLLKITGDGHGHSIPNMIEHLTVIFNLSEEERHQLFPSGKQTTFYNRTCWAITHMSHAGLIEKQRQSGYCITARGREVLGMNLSQIGWKFLMQYPEYVEFNTKAKLSNRQPSHEKPQSSGIEKITEERTPEEVLEDAYQEIREGLAQDLLTTVKGCSPAFFERLVVELLVTMGYGGSRRDAARAVGQIGDGGIDGIIDEDRLGLDAIYIQAKRWDNGTVGRPEIQRFVGALMGKRARKGIFITTSTFSADAVSFVNTIDYKIVLIDGKRLADLMIDYGIGVTELTSYHLKRIDSDYFNVA